MNKLIDETLLLAIEEEEEVQAPVARLIEIGRSKGYVTIEPKFWSTTCP